MNPKLLNQRIATPATDGFERIELQGSPDRLAVAGEVTNGSALASYSAV